MSEAEFNKVADQTEKEIEKAEAVIPIICEQQEQPEPEKLKVLNNPPSAIAIGTDGRVIAKNNAELMRYCGALTLGAFVPERFKTPQMLFAALMFVRDLKLPDVAIRQVAVIHGTPSLFGDLPLALVQMTGNMLGFREVWFDKEYKEIKFENANLDNEAYGAVCFLGRKNGTEIGVVQSFSFTMKDAEKAGLYPAKKRDGSPSPDSPWNKYTKMMLRYKARSIGLKSLFADAINGASIAEHDYDVMDPELDVTPPRTTLADKISQRTEVVQ